MEYIHNAEAEAIAVEVIADHHPHLEGCKIAYISKVKPPKKNKQTKQPRQGKKIVMAKASKVSPKMQALFELEQRAPYGFVIEFDHEIWEELPEEKRRALVDHELCHCGNDADGFYMKHHGLEEFPEIASRYGAWKSDIKQFMEAADEPFHQQQGAGE